MRALIVTRAPVHTTFGVEDRLGSDVRGDRVTVFRRPA